MCYIHCLHIIWHFCNFALQTQIVLFISYDTNSLIPNNNQCLDNYSKGILLTQLAF